MLPRQHRVRRSADFRAVTRSGPGTARVSRGAVTVHVRVPTGAPGAAPWRAGLVVGKAVGGSVARHAVARRLRHQLAALFGGPLATAPAGTEVVVRAQPAAATASSTTLRTDLHDALTVALARASRPGTRPDPDRPPARSR